MKATDVVAIVASVSVAVLVGAFVMMLATLARTLRELRGALDEFMEATLPLVVEMRDTVSEAAVELDRVERLVSSAETVTETIDSASRLAYRTLASPVVKAMALRAGLGRASRRLRGDARGPDRSFDHEPDGASDRAPRHAARTARRATRRAARRGGA